MEIIRFGPETSHPIHDFESRGVALARLSTGWQEVHTAVIYIDPGGVIGNHPAAGDQLFIVVQGSGWVAGADRRRVPIGIGQAVFWQAGEWHESGSGQGMTVVVIEK